MIHDTTPLSRALVLRTSFTVHCMGLSGHLYPDFHLPAPPNISYLLQPSINLSHFFLPSILQFLLLCIPLSLSPFFLGTSSYYTWKTDFSSTVSNFLPFVSSIPNHTFYFPNRIATSLYIFLEILY